MLDCWVESSSAVPMERTCGPTKHNATTTMHQSGQGAAARNNLMPVGGGEEQLRAISQRLCSCFVFWNFFMR